MSIKYELSLWRDYPGSTGIREEKMDILAATGMDFAGRAQNIVLKREHTGKITLEFEIPVKYFDIIEGTMLTNPLCTQVCEKAKIKLWRDELWWNPFGGTQTFDEKTECYRYSGEWTQGRWYDLIVNSHKEKRSKKQLFYSFTCNSLFMDELSRNGYSLQFVPDTDIMSANGMGTAHDLAERIAEGTDWDYIKTEVFPDYKEEFNAVTGETVKTPVSTDRIEFVKGLNRYCYCYELEVDGVDEQSKITDNILEQLTAQDLKTITKDNLSDYCGFTNNKFWWKQNSSALQKEFVYGHLKTNIKVNNAKNIYAIDCGDMKYYVDDKSSNMKYTGATTFTEGITAWEAAKGEISLSSSGDAATGTFISLMDLTTGTDNESVIYYRGAQDQPLSQGDTYCTRISANHSFNDNFDENTVQFEVWDAAISTNYAEPNEETTDKPIIKIPVQCIPDNGNDNRLAFALTHWFVVPKYIQQPVFVIRSKKKSQKGNIGFKALYLYELKGYNSAINDYIISQRGKTSDQYGLVDDLLQGVGTVLEETEINIAKNLWKDQDGYNPLWLGFGKISAEGYQSETYQYPIEFSINGGYYDVYLPLNNNSAVTLNKMSSYNTDKRRTISGEKSNRFSLLETVAKTFQCFTRFVVEHDNNGQILLDVQGKPIKRFTFVSELGRRNFNGFNYGVNLENIERSVDANNLVTKCHVESIANEYNDSGMITIQDSIYNKLGMTFIYNFSYYLLKGMLNKSVFLQDYQNMINYVNIRVNENMTLLETYSPISLQKTQLETDISTYQILLDSYKSTALEKLADIKWDRFINGGTFNKNDEDYTFKGHKKEGIDAKFYNFPNIDITKLQQYTSSSPTTYYYYGETGIEKATDKNDKEHYIFPDSFHSIDDLAKYMYLNHIACLNNTPLGKPPGLTKYSASECWAAGIPENDIKNTLNSVFSLQTLYKAAEQKILDYTTLLNDSVMPQIERYNNKTSQNTREINHKINWFERRYQQFVTEGQWSGQDYIDANAYYLDATRAQAEACMPKVSYSIGAIDLSQLCNPFNPSETDWGKEFSYDVGDTTYVKDEELFGDTEQLTMIANITSYIDTNKQDNIEMRNYETRFEELFQSVAAAVTSVQTNENIWGRAENFAADGTIDETILNASFANNANLVIASANNSVVQDNKGLTVIDNDTGKITRLIGGGIFLSSDGGQNYKAGLTPDGFNASLITAGRIDTSKIVIRSTDTPLFYFDTQGLTANRPIENSFTRFDQFGIYSTNKANRFGTNWWTIQTEENEPEQFIVNNSVFSLTRLGLDMKYKKGGLTFGTIGYDTSGKANKWGLRVTKDGKTTVEIDHNGNAIFAGELKAATGSFSGKLDAATGDFTGKVTANRGKIGSWTIDSNKMYFYPGDINSNSTGSVDGSGNKADDVGGGTGFMGGSTYYTNPYFYAGYNHLINYELTGDRSAFPTVKNSSWVTSGVVKCQITQSGDFQSTGGVSLGGGSFVYNATENLLTITGSDNDEKDIVKIGGWSIKRDKLIGTGTGGKQCFMQAPINGNQWFICAGHTQGNHANAPFRVDYQGNLTCTSATIKGTIKADDGYFGSCTIGEWKYSGSSAKIPTINLISSDKQNGVYLSSLKMSAYRDGDIPTASDYSLQWVDLIVYMYDNIELYSSESDMNVKNSISEFNSKYDNLFDNLIPCKYKYNHGTSERFHTGFIAQEVVGAIENSGLTTKEFAGVIHLEKPNINGCEWLLRRDEFVALNTWQIQKLKTRVAELERKLESLTKTNTSDII